MLKNEWLNFGLVQRIQRELLFTIEFPASSEISGIKGGYS